MPRFALGGQVPENSVLCPRSVIFVGLQAAPSLAERVAWMQILNETACKVSKMFRRTADKVAHVHSVDVQDASAALWEVREHLETQQL